MPVSLVGVYALFSAYAEVFLSRPFSSSPIAAFLCLRRGVSPEDWLFKCFDGFSLPTQRCFHQLSQCDETLLTFLCLRRGVSLIGFYVPHILNFSLPTQRCFSCLPYQKDMLRLFSAYAEVFPMLHLIPKAALPFLCLRRGVSNSVLKD